MNMPAYNAGEMDEEKTRQRRWRAQDIEGGREDGGRERRGRERGTKRHFQSAKIGGLEMPNGRKGEKKESERKRRGKSPEYRREQDTHRKQKNPPLYGREGDFGNESPIGRRKNKKISKA